MDKRLNRDTPATQHYPALDGLRGLAVLLVMVHHYVRSYTSLTDFHSRVIHLTTFMWAGVDLFFVLSGFLITGILVETLRSTNYLRTFYARRILRIFPLYYGLLVLVFVVLPLVGMGASTESPSKLLNLLTFTTNIHFALSGWGNNAFDVYWSLAVEEQFYLFWPLTLLLVPTRYHKALIIAGLAACIVVRYIGVKIGVSAVFLFTMLPTHADGLLVGALLAIVIRERRKLPALGTKIPVVIFLIVVAFFVACTLQFLGLRPYYDAWNTRGAMFYYLVIAAAFGCVLVILIAEPNPIQRLFTNRYLRRVGTYSYCLYLIHQFAVPFVNWFYWKTGFERLLQMGSPVWMDLAHLSALFLLSFGVAALSWRFVEQPILRLKRYFPYRHDATA